MHVENIVTFSVQVLFTSGGFRAFLIVSCILVFYSSAATLKLVVLLLLVSAKINIKLSQNLDIKTEIVLEYVTRQLGQV